MKSREQLQDEYEEALFALMMDELMEYEGKLLGLENQRLKQEGFSIPTEVDNHCRNTIVKRFEDIAKENESRKIKRVWHTVLVAALISCLLFTSAYATVPSIRIATDNFIMKISNFSANMLFGDEYTETRIPEYSFLAIPEKYDLIEEINEPDLDQYLYSDGTGYILIRVNYNCVGKEHNVDVENAESVREVDINGFKGILVNKENRVHLAIMDMNKLNFIDVICTDVEDEVTNKFIYGIKSRE